MRRQPSIALAALAVIAVLFIPNLTWGQTTERVWEQGTVWSITYVETKPNMFNEYLKNLSQVWVKFLEEQKKTGDVISWKMLSVQNTRDGEPDLMLLVEYKNMAVFDRGVAYFDELSKKIMGGLDKAMMDNIDREKMRTIRSSVLTRELTFKQMAGQ